MATLEASKLYRINRTVQPTTIILGCLDPWRVNDLFRFASEDLGLKDGEFIPLLNPGGIMHLSIREFPHDHLNIFDKVKFCFAEFPFITDVVGVNHDECGGYRHAHKAIGSRFLGDLQMRDLQMKHLRGKWISRVRTAARVRPPGVKDLRVRAFHMFGLENDPDQTFFKEIEIE